MIAHNLCVTCVCELMLVCQLYVDVGVSAVCRVVICRDVAGILSMLGFLWAGYWYLSQSLSAEDQLHLHKLFHDILSLGYL